MHFDKRLAILCTILALVILAAIGNSVYMAVLQRQAIQRQSAIIGVEPSISNAASQIATATSSSSAAIDTDAKNISTAGVSFTASPLSGDAPLNVTFTLQDLSTYVQADPGIQKFDIDTGNGAMISIGGPGDYASTSVWYISPGTYTAKLMAGDGLRGYQIGSPVTITVTGTGRGQPSINVDQNSLMASSSGNSAIQATISGTALNISCVSMQIENSQGPFVFTSQNTPVSNNRWSITTTALTPGTYGVLLYDCSDVPTAYDDGSWHSVLTIGN